jgi:hypothetical protein
MRQRELFYPGNLSAVITLPIQLRCVDFARHDENGYWRLEEKRNEKAKALQRF